MIELKLDFTYEGQKQKALNDVECEILRGQCVVLCGHSGCGKSTIGRSINKLIPDFYEGQLNGYCKIMGKDLKSISIGEAGEIVSSVFQDPRSQFFTMNSCTELAFALENFGVQRESIEEKIDSAFAFFSLERLKDRNVFELSAGERQLIAILCMWVLDTEICLLDEPTANLDYTAIHELTRILKLLKEQGKTIVINEHRLYYILDVADEYWVVENGKIKEKITNAEISQMSDLKLNQMGLRTNSLETIVFKTEMVENQNESKFVIENICYKYKKSKINVLKQFSYTSKIGDVVAIVGTNGCGKTTLGKILTGLIQEQSGMIQFRDSELSKKERVKESLFIMQETEFQFFTNSVFAELTYGKEATHELNLEIEQMLKKLDLWSLRNRHPFSLSGGQMQKLVLLIAYFSTKPVLVLDEPTAGLDYKSLTACVDLIKEMRKTKVIFVITHDLELIAASCNKAVFIKSGKNQREFTINTQNEFDEFREYFQKHLTEKTAIKSIEKSVKLIDPRFKILLTMMAVLLEMLKCVPLLTIGFIELVLVMIYEKRYKWAVLWSCIFASTVIPSIIFSSIYSDFMASFLPRFVFLGATVYMITASDGASKMIAGLRKLKINEKIIMVISVTFRFFPAMRNDIHTMMQSIKTRGFFDSLFQKARHFVQYVETMIVPIAFRSIRIAEALSSSAQIRGIDLKRKRSSYIFVKFSTIDYIFLAQFIITLVIIAILYNS